MWKFTVFCALLVAYVSAQQSAIVNLLPNSNGSVTGSVTFNKTSDGIVISGSVSGLTAGKHGFHIHEKGDTSGGCATTGGHFNPHNVNHGARDAKVRHVGDLGNIEADANGVANINIVDSVIALSGEHSIIGRAVVVHEGEDDLGLGGNEGSLTTGNAGGRAACGVIGILESSASVPVLSTVFTVLITFAALSRIIS